MVDYRLKDIESKLSEITNTKYVHLGNVEELHVDSNDKIRLTIDSIAKEFNHYHDCAVYVNEDRSKYVFAVEHY